VIVIVAIHANRVSIRIPDIILAPRASELLRWHWSNFFNFESIDTGSAVIFRANLNPFSK
jgi:hypothetical protein